MPDDPEFREKLATIISSVGRCDRDALLEGTSFATVMPDFDSIMVLEILLEIETEFHITTDDMLPTDGAYKPQEITNAFPEDLDGLMAYMRTVVARLEAKKLAAKEAAVAAAEVGEAPASSEDAEGAAARNESDRAAPAAAAAPKVTAPTVTAPGVKDES
ncbi:acyl carrier protein [Achromobacter spanius]|uniref:acyl carrier protein n=1 Tax=Achromobacter spanius TaxID=217203 RepID=UPI003813D311